MTEHSMALVRTEYDCTDTVMVSPRRRAGAWPWAYAEPPITQFEIRFIQRFHKQLP